MADAWAPYLAMISNKCPKPHFSGIFGQDGTPWIDQNTGATAAEVQALVSGFNEPESLQANGFFIGGNKFVFARIDQEENYLLGKAKKDHPSCPGGPVSIMKTKTALIIAFGNTDVPAGLLNIGTLDLGNYLVQSNY